MSHEKESQIPINLINNLRDGKVIAWVGAGLSMGVGYPSWTGLMNAIAENIASSVWRETEVCEWVISNAEKNPEWVAEVLSETNRKQYFESIAFEFKKEAKRVSSFTHAILALLPFKGYITTNFDTLIEDHIELFTSYSPSVFKKENALSLLTENVDKKFVYKVHGDINSSPENITLTETGYYALQRDGVYNKILSWLFSKYSIVCLGYSLRDNDFRFILNERYELFGGNCPPMYVFTSSEQTCEEEISCYSKKFNVHIISISPDYNFAELTSTLLSMYCLCHRVESESNSEDIINMICRRMTNEAYPAGIIDKPEMARAHRIISVLKDPLEIDEIVSILWENDIKITTAHAELLCRQFDEKRVVCEDSIETDADKISVAKIMKKNIDIIPVDDNPKFLSSYYKSIFDKYHQTLSYLLQYRDSFNILITTENELKRIVEYYKQQGFWREWLAIADVAQDFCHGILEIELLRSQAWIYFWIRDYAALQNLINHYPVIETESGVNNYKAKLYYMTPAGLNELVQQLEDRLDKRDYFDISLLGRAYARLSVVEPGQKDHYLAKAEEILKEALDQAIKFNDMIEIAVQNWYLSLVFIDQGRIDKAKIHLAETKRLDENIMERKPGIAWLRVAEYRLAKTERAKDERAKWRIAYSAMDNLGMKNIAEYLEKDYFF